MAGSGKFFRIRSRLNGMVLDVNQENYSIGTPVTTYEEHGGNNQIFYEDIKNHVIRCKDHPEFVLDMMGETLVINTFGSGESSQMWSVDAGFIRNYDDRNSVLDVRDNCCDPGAEIVSWEFNGDDNQQWDIEYTNPVYMVIRSQMNGKVIDVREANADPGAKLIMYDQNSGLSDNQLFYEDRNGVLRSKLNDFVFDCAQGSIRLEPYDGLETQQWIVHLDRIENLVTGDVIDIKDEDDGNGAKLCSYGYHGNSNQRWSFEYMEL